MEIRKASPPRLAAPPPRIGVPKPAPDRKTPARLLTWIDAGERLSHARATGAPAFAIDGRLSVEARGMLAYMLATRPERSPAKADALFAECGIGSHKGYRILQELRDAAYVVLHREREQGRIVTGEWEITPEQRRQVRGDSLSPLKQPRGVTNAPETGDTGDGDGCQGVTRTIKRTIKRNRKSFLQRVDARVPASERPAEGD